MNYAGLNLIKKKNSDVKIWWWMWINKERKQQKGIHSPSIISQLQPFPLKCIGNNQRLKKKIFWGKQSENALMSGDKMALWPECSRLQPLYSTAHPHSPTIKVIFGPSLNNQSEAVSQDPDRSVGHAAFWNSPASVDDRIRPCHSAFTLYILTVWLNPSGPPAAADLRWVDSLTDFLFPLYGESCTCPCCKDRDVIWTAAYLKKGWCHLQQMNDQFPTSFPLI